MSGTLNKVKLAVDQEQRYFGERSSVRRTLRVELKAGYQKNKHIEKHAQISFVKLGLLSKYIKKTYCLRIKVVLCKRLANAWQTTQQKTSSAYIIIYIYMFVYG